MSIEQNLKQLEASIALSKSVVAFNQAVERLQKNQDFKTVILDGYFREEAIRLVELKADPSMQSATSQASIVAQIDAIGGLISFLRTAAQTARMAEKAIASDEETIAELQVDAA